MKTEIDIIVEDIVATLPPLASDAVLVREIVAHLLENKPRVEVDEAFRASLRQELLQSINTHKNTKSTLSPWWFIYIAPVGVTAVLLILLQPSQTQAPQDFYETSTMPSESSLKMDNRAGSEEQSRAMTPEADMDGGYAYSSADVFAISTSPDRSGFVLDYISLSRPGFVVVATPQGVQVATSRLIPSGEHEGISLAATRPLQQGIIYTAHFYYDNGDGVYIEAEENPALDENGEPLTVLTSVTN